MTSSPDVIRPPHDAFFPAAIVDGIGVGLVVVDREFRIQQANEFVARWVKRDRASLVGNKCHALFHRRATPCEDCPCAVTFRTGGSARVVHTGVDAEGGVTHAEISSQPMFDRGGEVAWALESVADVSDRVRHEQEIAGTLKRLRTSEEQLLRRNNELEVVNAILAAAGTALDVPEILKGALTGALRLAGLANRGCIFLVDEERRELRLATHTGMDEEFLRCEQRVPFGDCLCGEAAQSGRVIFSACSADDVLHTRMRGAPPHGHLVVPLKSQEQVLGVMALYLADGHAVSAEQQRLFATLGRQVGVAIDNAMAYRRTDQNLQRKVVELTHAVAKVEQEKARAQASEQAKDQFITMVSHDLRSPLAVITTAASSACDHPGCEDCREASDAILRSARRMKEMIGNVVDSARLESGALHLRREHVSLPDLLSQLVAMGIPAADRPRVTLMRAASSAAVVGDRSWIERALLNLVGNAMKFGPPGSTIGMTLSVKDGQAHVEVTDDGPGVPPADRPHLFERYFRASSTSHVQGSGLGLYITRMVAEAHGGRVRLDDNRERGAAFILSLPLAPAP